MLIIMGKKMLKPIFEKIRDEEGYDLILDNSAGGVIMASQQINISEKVLAQLNQANGG